MVVPIEIVTSPVTQDGVARLDRACTALYQAGAKAPTRASLLGLRVHYNIEVTHAQDAYTCDTIRAFVLIEDLAAPDRSQ